MNPFEKLLSKKKPDHPYAFVPGTSVREPISGREAEYRPWETLPRLSVDESPEVMMHQGEVHDMHLGLLNRHLPDDLPHATLNALTTHITPRAGKDIRDYQGNHERSLVILPELELDDLDLAIHHKVDLATANISEIVSNAERIKRGTGEVAILRVINGYRAEYEDSMVAELAGVLGPHFQAEEPRKFRIVGLDENYLRGEPMESITWGYKQYYGKLPSGIEFDSRRSFVTRTDPASGFDPGIREVIQNAVQSDLGMGHVPHLKRVREVFDEIVETGPAHPLVAGAVIKIYLFNQAVDTELAQRFAEQRKQQQAFDAFDTSKIHYKGPKLS